MSKATLGFIYTGLAWLVIGVTTGVLMGLLGGNVTRSLVIPHAHMNLLGWLSFFVYGVGYHILPRFRGTPLYSEKLATAQMYLANAALAGLVVFWIVWANGGGVTFQIIWGIAAGLEALAAYLFVYNLARTFLKKVD